MTKRPDGGNGDIQQAVDALVRRVPHHAIRTVIEQIDQSKTAGDARAQALRDALVEQFNRLRPQRARRLFTSLFEPLLIDDPVLYRARDPIPGLVQRVDAGGLWSALEHHAFPALARDVQNRLDEMSQGAIIDEVLVSDEAIAMRSKMCRAAVEFLGALPRNKKAFDQFLVLANQEALKDARQRSPHLTAKLPIGGEMLMGWHAYLEESHRLLPILNRVVAEVGSELATGDQREAEVDAQAALLVGYAREMRGLCPTRGPLDPVLWLPALTALNVKRRYDVIRRYLREYAPATSIETHPMHMAVFGHFAAANLTLGDLAQAIAGQADQHEGLSLAMPRPVRELLWTAVNRFDLTLQTISATGLMSNRSVGPRVRPLLTELTSVLVGTAMPCGMERALAALNARNYPEADHDDVVLLLEVLRIWSSTLGTLGYAAPNTREMKTRLKEEGRLAFQAAIKIEPEDVAERRIDHVVRINQILSAIGESISPWISPMSQGLQNMVRYELEFGRDRSAATDFVIDRYIDAIRNELGRSRHWQSVELLSLMKLYETRAR